MGASSDGLMQIEWLLLNSNILMFYATLIKVKVVMVKLVTNVILLNGVLYVKNYVYICKTKNWILQL